MSKQQQVGEAVKPTSPKLIWIGWAVIIIVPVMIFTSIWAWTQRPSATAGPKASVPSLAGHHTELGPNPMLGYGRLDVVYSTKDGTKYEVNERQMAENFVAPIDQIKDEAVWKEWNQLLTEQLNLLRNDPRRFMFVMWGDRVGLGGPGGASWFEIHWETPRPGCFTLWCNPTLLLYPERSKNRQTAELMAEVTAVHELQHIRDWQAGRMGAIRQVCSWTLGDWIKQGSPEYNLLMRSKAEAFASELRAFDAEFRYVRKYRFDDWQPASDFTELGMYQAWMAGRTEELRSLVYDWYEPVWFPPSWKYNKAEMKTWMLNQVADVVPGG